MTGDQARVQILLDAWDAEQDFWHAAEAYNFAGEPNATGYVEEAIAILRTHRGVIVDLGEEDTT